MEITAMQIKIGLSAIGGMFAFISTALAVIYKYLLTPRLDKKYRQVKDSAKDHKHICGELTKLNGKFDSAINAMDKKLSDSIQGVQYDLKQQATHIRQVDSQQGEMMVHLQYIRAFVDKNS